jgi:N utilization substance protein B
MPGRHHARELAMQALFSIEVGGLVPAEAIANVIADIDGSETRQFVNTLVFDTLEHQAELDAVIIPLLNDWTLDRLPAVDRIVLRMALYELRYLPQTPPAVVLDEAIEIVKRFSTEESGAFVNGLLAKAIET